MMSQGASMISLFVTSEDASSERRFDKHMTISTVKERLESITGVSSANMQLQLFNKQDVLLAMLDDDTKMLGYYPVEEYFRINVINTDPYRIKNEFSDVSRVAKFEMDEKTYDSRADSVRDFKRRNKLGRFADRPEGEATLFQEEASKISVGSRFEAVLEDGMPRRGNVKYVGETHFKPGFWVGVEYDEPLGKHNGTVDGEAYFACRPKHGAFLRPDKLAVGDYPEVDIDLDDLDEI